MAVVTIHSDFDPKKRKSVTASTFPPSICHEVMGPDAMILVFWMLSFKPASSGGSKLFIYLFIQFSLVAQSCLTLCHPMNHSMPGLPVHHQLPESTQTHVHRVDDAIQPSHPLLCLASPALNLSQHQGLFQWVSFSHQVAKVLEFQTQQNLH